MRYKRLISSQRYCHVHNVTQDVVGNMAMAWDERGHVSRNEYDELLRPTKTYVDEGSGEQLVALNIYGDNVTMVDSTELNNLRGQAIRSFDQSGVNKLTEVDFKGNPLVTEQSLAANYKTTIDWTALLSETSLEDIDNEAETNFLENDVYQIQINYDALNRPILITQPDGSQHQPSYAKSGLLKKMEVQLAHESSFTEYISNIIYNARGQRTDIFYANASKSKYEYNTATFRLDRLLTTRNTGSDILQDLNYTFDAVGNIVEQVDDAQQTHYFQNSVIAPNGKYEYDALYRLIKASGREHAGQGQAKEDDIDVQTPVPHANQSDAVINYTETYEYDEIGNIEKLVHTALNNNWTRGYDYDNSSNYLLKTSMPGDTIVDPLTYSSVYTYDVHGNMKSMPHLSDMIWNATDNLTEVDLGSAGTAYYRYDAAGNRIRKVIENGSSKKERLYLDGVEIWREYSSEILQKERESLNISDEAKVFLRVETLTTEGGTPIGSPTSNWRYQYANHLESACLELDDSANIISYEEYHPFGSSSYRSGDNVAEVSLKLYRYNGKERDDETGLYNYGMRYYCAWLCRFISVDPLKDDYPHYTSYQYAGNKPITYIDLDGLEEADPETGTISVNIYLQRDKNVSDEEFNNWFDKWSGSINNVWNSGNLKINENKVNTGGVNYIQAGPNFDPSSLGENDVLFTVGKGDAIKDSHPDEVATKSSFVNGGNALDASFGNGYMFISDPGSGAHEFGHLFGLSDRYHEVVDFVSVKGSDELIGNPRKTIPMILPNKDIDPDYNPNNNLYSDISDKSNQVLTDMQLDIVFSNKTEDIYPSVVIINSKKVQYKSAKVNNSLFGPKVSATTTQGHITNNVNWARAKGIGFQISGGLAKQSLYTNYWKGNREANRELIRSRTR